jgi:hypothetical protein
LTETLERKYFSTLRATGERAPCTVLTARAARDVHSQLRFDTRTRNSERRRVKINPRWLEWFMGYPAEWTKRTLTE